MDFRVLSLAVAAGNLTAPNALVELDWTQLPDDVDDDDQDDTFDDDQDTGSGSGGTRFVDWPDFDF